MSGKIRYGILVYVAAALLAAAYPAKGATIQAAAVSVTDVISAIASASDGDTVVIPAGTATWTTKVTISKAITLQGSGVGRTIIMDGVQSGPFLTFSLVAGKSSRLTGIEFRNGGRTSWANPASGVFEVLGSNLNNRLFRMDHCKWLNLNGPLVFQTVIGVLDHNEFISTTNHPFFYLYNNYWGGGANGDVAMAEPSNFGTDRFLFFEDNICTNNGGLATHSVAGLTDAYGGARFVIRHNQIYRFNIQNHGTEGARRRGGRAIEVYNNTFTGNDDSNIVGTCRSGVVLFHGNTFSGWRSNPRYSLREHRIYAPYAAVWSTADGTNQWDENAPGGPFFTGSASGASVGLTVTVFGNPGWTANQWVGYSVKRTTNLGGANGPAAGEIQSNTSNTLTYSDSGETGDNLSFANGDVLQIWKVNHAIDQPGRSGGSLIRGEFHQPGLRIGMIKSQNHAIPGITLPKVARMLILPLRSELSEKTSTFSTTG